MGDIMFEQLYKIVSDELSIKGVNDINVIEKTFKENIERLFLSYFPHYDKFLGNPMELVEQIAKNACNSQEEFVEEYNKMIDYLNGNIYKWKQYLDNEQFIESVAKTMSNEYIRSLSINTSSYNK